MTETATTPRTTTRLTDRDTGRWLVKTETSSYLLDLDDRTSVRNPDAGAGAVDELPAPETAQLRRDTETLPLLELAACEVGRPMTMLIDVLGDGVTTSRRTTIVREITETR